MIEVQSPIFRETAQRLPKSHKKTRHDSDVQAGSSEEMKRAGLLERFFDVFRGFDVEDRARFRLVRCAHVRRVVQASTKECFAHPDTRVLSSTQIG